MATWVSDNGKCYPAKEIVQLTNKGDEAIESEYIFGTEVEGIAQPGEMFTYKGPDRQALAELAETGDEHLGVDFRDCSEFQDFINKKHQGNTEQYLKRVGHDDKKARARFEETFVKVKAHEIPKAHREAIIMGGGQAPDKSQAVVGGFGDQKPRSLQEAKSSTKKS